MKKTLIFALLATSFGGQASDSIGFVSTGGIEYIQNDKIAMQSEDLFIRQGQIKVSYQYKNLTDKDIRETLWLPLPIVMNQSGGDFADTKGLVEHFNIWVNDAQVKPEVHVRAFLYEEVKKGGQSEFIPTDVTEAFKTCGISDEEMQDPWTQKFDGKVEQKILKCQDPALAKFNLAHIRAEEFVWGSQIIYSWQQTFKANQLTDVKYEYQPLVGGSVSLPEPQDDDFDRFAKHYCIDQPFKKTVVKHWGEYGLPYKALGYMLTDGSQRTKSIEDFTLTIERNKNELLSFCWDTASKINKIKDEGNVVQFQVKEKNFLPKQNVAVIFVPIKSE